MADHVLVFPFPLQGHVNSMLKLAELLSLAGLHVTFLNTDHNLRLLARHSIAYARLDRSPRFRFRSIPDGFEDESRRSASRLLDLLESLQTRSVGPYKELLLDLQHRDEDGYRGWPALTCVIADGIMTFAADVARELGVPAMFFRTVSACSIWSYLCIPELLRTGELPFPDDADLDEPIRNVPGMEGFLRRRDLSIFCRNAKDSSCCGGQLFKPWPRGRRGSVRGSGCRGSRAVSLEVSRWPGTVVRVGTGGRVGRKFRHSARER